ncbi:hypothetical protein B0J11DRAFT_500469 [Dendryphion nanum]|uniref:Uncharacterized protein n=1 Tax=Dendryphion nanum TaxID=256645 RepID=A0A9P9EK15_9PLEO|nr:hypothetical protein B0J11DRAFT_500469 [Dendryphion nanum]
MARGTQGVRIIGLQHLDGHKLMNGKKTNSSSPDLISRTRSRIGSRGVVLTADSGAHPRRSSAAHTQGKLVRSVIEGMWAVVACSGAAAEETCRVEAAELQRDAWKRESWCVPKVPIPPKRPSDDSDDPLWDDNYRPAVLGRLAALRHIGLAQTHNRSRRCVCGRLAVGRATDSRNAGLGPRGTGDLGPTARGRRWTAATISPRLRHAKKLLDVDREDHRRRVVAVHLASSRLCPVPVCRCTGEVVLVVSRKE